MSGTATSLSARCRALCGLTLAALLSACAANHTAPLTATQEAATYIARAKPSYAPPGPPDDPWGPYVAEASKKFDVPERWVREVMRVESGGHEFRASGALITSPVGAMGLMQLMPETYDEVRARYGLGDDAFDPHNNIMAGTAYLREMYDTFGSPGMLAAYNGGPARLEDYLTHNRPLPTETRRYVAMIAPYIRGTWPQSRSPAEQYAVNRLPEEIPAGPRYAVHHVLVAVRGRHGHETVRYASADRHRGRWQAPVELAEAPEPRRPVHATLRLASVSMAPHHGFHLFSQAMASELAPRHEPSGHRAASGQQGVHATAAGLRPPAAAHHAVAHACGKSARGRGSCA